tara:strand:+ start:52 stop:378 length:327 start_codon:yes stop_codon:yes gene_type:complete
MTKKTMFEMAFPNANQNNGITFTEEKLGGENMEYREAKQQFLAEVDELEDRDLMYFLLHQISGKNPNPDYYHVLQAFDDDNLTGFMADHISNSAARNWIKELLEEREL